MGSLILLLTVHSFLNTVLFKDGIPLLDEADRGQINTIKILGRINNEIFHSWGGGVSVSINITDCFGSEFWLQLTPSPFPPSKV